MPSTPRGYPYPTLSDAPDGPAQLQALATAIDTDVNAIDTATDGLTLRRTKVWPRPTPNAAPGSPGLGGNQTHTVASVVISDPGYEYYVEAAGSLMVGIFSGATTSLTGVYLQINLDEAAFAPTPATRIFERTTHPAGNMPQHHKLSTSYYRAALTGSHTVYLLLRNESSPSNFLTYADNEYYTFNVTLHPST